MSKLLKLTGIASLSCPAFNTVIVKKTQTIRVDDKLGDHLMTGKRLNAEGEDVPYWTEVVGVTPDYDFSTEPKVAETAAKVADTTEKPAAARRAGSRQRASA